MTLNQEQRCLLWLSSAEITPKRVQELTFEFETAQGIWDGFAMHGSACFQPSSHEKLNRLHCKAAMDDLIAELNKRNVHLLFQADEAYPEMLKHIDDPPYLLYYAGRVECLQMPAVAIVGTRKASSYGQEMAGILAQGLCNADVCVVSGLARGIDAAAHQGALLVNGHTIGVLGSGINVPYPPEHTPLLRKIAGGIGLIISEYPLNAEPTAYHFPHRNRIISGLSLGVVFVEGKIKSGGMHTVSSALAQGREVFAVPGHVGTIGCEGPHTILREGARIVTCAQDLLEDLGISPPQAAQRKAKRAGNLNHYQEQILDALRIESLSADELAKKLGKSAQALISELGMLEILGYITREAGNRFTLPIGAGR
ncbi:MAG: DNA-processing protein DprA [Clostridia bacterium]